MAFGSCSFMAGSANYSADGNITVTNSNITASNSSITVTIVARNGSTLQGPLSTCTPTGVGEAGGRHNHQVLRVAACVTACMHPWQLLLLLLLLLLSSVPPTS
jgi:hypothetical protein